MFMDDGCAAKFLTIGDHVQSVLQKASKYEQTECDNIQPET